jgi:hypothetical protein
MTRYYRTSMGDDPASATVATHTETTAPTDDATRPKKHSRRSRPSPSIPAGADTSAKASGQAASPRASTPHPGAMPLRRAVTSNDRDKSLALLKEEVGLSKSNRRLLIIGGAVVGVGALAMLLSGGAERGKAR